jgi:hypothetical protein
MLDCVLDVVSIILILAPLGYNTMGKLPRARSDN